MNSDAANPSSQSDMLDPARAAALQVALGQIGDIGVGDPLPAFFHQLYFWTPQVPSELGRDGHPKVGGLIPDMGLPRRMWAGGRLQFYADLRAGEVAQKTTHCESHTRKEGRTGPLGFVTLRHEITQNGQLRVTEWQDLVYRKDPLAGAPKPVPPVARIDEASAEDVSFNQTLLFRYSALTFNGHRIHYDLDYARDVEGYAGLVVHGPLLAHLLMRKAVRERGPLKAFSFRATAPLMHFETATLCHEGSDLWVRGPDGRQCMAASVEV